MLIQGVVPSNARIMGVPCSSVSCLARFGRFEEIVNGASMPPAEMVPVSFIV